MKAILHNHLCILTLLTLIVTANAPAQPVLGTLLGAASDGIAEGLAALNNVSAISVAPSGDLYVALAGGHQIVRIDSSGKVWLVAGNGQSGSTGDGGPAIAATLINPVAIALDTSGNLYIADPTAQVVRKVGADGIISTFAGNGHAAYTGDGGPATKASLANPLALACDARGNVLIADNANSVVRSVSPAGIITTIAGTGARGIATSSGLATQNPLSGPSGVAIDASGDLFIADTGNNMIQVVTPDGTMSRYAGKQSTSPFAGTNDPTYALDAELSVPTGLALDQSGSLYFIEHARVRRITPDGKIALYAGTGQASLAGDGGLAIYADINVQGVAVDMNGNLLIADGYNNRVRIVDSSNGVIATIAGSGSPSFVPQGLAVSGNLVYFSDIGSNNVWSIDLTSGSFHVFAGVGLSGSGVSGDSAIFTKLNSPDGIAVDSAGNIYMADSRSNVVREATAGGIIKTIAGNGSAGTSGDGSAATSASLNLPYGVAVDSQGNVFISERTGNVVRKVSLDGTISRVAGTGVGGSPSAETGIALAQNLNVPQGLAMEPDGSVLIADSGNNRVRRMFPDGTIQTVAGTGLGGFSGDGGPATAAYLKNPTAVTLDSWGNLYIADTGNQRIRQVGPDGMITTLAGNGNSGFNGSGRPATAYSLSSPAGIVPYTGCSVLIADAQNNRIRQLWPAITYTITTNPPGAVIVVDGQAMSTSAVAPFLPGTVHSIDVLSPQAVSGTVRYISPGAQQLNVACGPARATYTLNLVAQYTLSVAADDGGSVTPVAAWQNAGAIVTLQATAKTGYVFSGWEGDCTGKGACQLVMNGPRGVKADFVPAQPQKGQFTSASVVGAGLSTPSLNALSSNGLAVIFGSNFAPTGTIGSADMNHLLDAKISTELDGVCVLVNDTAAPLLAVTPTQINFQSPHVNPGSADVKVVTGCGTSNQITSDSVSIPVQIVTPEFFYFTHSESGQNPIAAVDATTGVNVGSPGLLGPVTSAPAKPGDIVTLYATGLGATDSALAPGEVATQAASLTGTLQVTIGSVAVPASAVLYAGVSPGSVGLYQINLTIPASVPDGDQLVQMSVNGTAAPAGGYLTIQH